MATYQAKKGVIKVQVEHLLGKSPKGGWVHVGEGKGNGGAEGAHYYYRSQTAQGSHKSAPQAGRFGFDFKVDEPGKYAILVRAARDKSHPGDARNDIWIRVDGNTEKAMPKGTPGLTEGGGGFVKFKGGLSSKWSDLKKFSTPKHGDRNPDSEVMFDKGMHNITFAPRSTGLHIDSVKVVKIGGWSKAKALDIDLEPAKFGAAAAATLGVAAAAKAAEKAETAGGVEAGEALSATIAAASDDFESNKAAASADLEFGRDGAGAQSVGLRFSGLALEAEAEIESAYFVFTAAETSKGAAAFTIEVEDTTAARTYTRADAPDDRAYLDAAVDWAVEDWTAGETYKSADIAALIEAVIADEGLEALDALAFRIAGSGERVAESFEGGAAPELVVDLA
jgi:hypothetical protein